jgi:hypothetical protein
MKKKSRDTLQAAIAQAEKKCASARAIERSGPAEPGDLFDFAFPADPLLVWAVVLVHPDDPYLLYAIPADLNPLQGAADVAVPEHSMAGPLTLRCGCGMWIRQTDFGSGRRSGVLESIHVAEARRRLSQLARGQAEGGEDQEETDSDPDYADWIEDVSEAAQALAKRLETRTAHPLTIRLIDFNQNWFNEVPASRHATSLDQEIPEQLALAASSADLLASVSGMLASPSQIPSGIRIPFDCEGALVAFDEQEGISLNYFPAGEELPPEVSELVEGGIASQGQWVRGPRGHYRYFPSLAWRQGRIVLRIGADAPLLLAVRK